LYTAQASDVRVFAITPAVKYTTSGKCKKKIKTAELKPKVKTHGSGNRKSSMEMRVRTRVHRTFQRDISGCYQNDKVNNRNSNSEDKTRWDKIIPLHPSIQIQIKQYKAIDYSKVAM
jgi:hypothetical protein